jgi:outer membrane protein
MKSRLAVLCLVSLFTLTLGLPSWAADLSIGVVDPDKVLNSTTVGKKVKEALDDYQRTRQKLLDSQASELQTMQDDLVKQGALLSPTAKQEKEASFRQKADAYQQRLQQFTREYQTKRSEVLGEFAKKLEHVVREIAEKEKIALVVEKGGAGAGALILYSQPSIDLTDRVIKALNDKGVD